MPAINETRLARGKAQRTDSCRAEAQAALMTIINEAERRGWRPIETAIAIADAADELVYDLYGHRTATN